MTTAYCISACGRRYMRSFASDNSKDNTGERPSKCDICDRTFRKLGSLNDHKRTDTGKKPYKSSVRTLEIKFPSVYYSPIIFFWKPQFEPLFDSVLSARSRVTKKANQVHQKLSIRVLVDLRHPLRVIYSLCMFY